MELKHIKEEITNLQALRSRDEITSYGLEKLHEYTDIVAQLSLQTVSCFSAEQMEDAYRDGWNDRNIGTDTFHISNYS